LNEKSHAQKSAFKATSDVKKQLNDNRERTFTLMSSIEARHRIQIKQFNAAGARRVCDMKALLEIQCKGLSDEQRNSATKECNSKLGHYQVHCREV
jgi:hypothetical protein